jgi:hypothetical protein
MPCSRVARSPVRPKRRRRATPIPRRTMCHPTNKQESGRYGADASERLGLRHPGGELVRPQFDFRGLATLQPYRVWPPQEKRLDQKAGSPLGCLNLLGVLSGGLGGDGDRSEATKAARRPLTSLLRGV